ncbi:MAG: disulfide bond formation protein B [Alphaproteobacteria bacterium]|nr:disulfide bond formation protein B [Alphaproteobacteria bacterium]
MTSFLINILWCKPFHLLIALSIIIIATVYFTEYVLGHAPCPLCLYQRLPWYGLIILGFIGWHWQNRLDIPSRLILLGTALLMLGGAMLAGYHGGVEFGWWPGPSTCGKVTGNMSVVELKAKLLATAPVRCDEIRFRIFGGSLALWNFVVSTLIFLGIVLWLLRAKQHRQGNFV